MLQTLERVFSGAQKEREYDALERERLETDQVTEASERLNGAMENVFEYTYQNGDFYFQGQALKPIFDNGIRTAQEIVRLRPEFAVELRRRLTERQQLNEQIELIQNVDWQDPLILVHISPTPDAVLKDEVDLNAYDKKRKKIMIRITEPTLDGVKVTSMSLDGNDRVALRAVGGFFGVDIPDDASSEDILDMRFLAEKNQFASERPAKVLREHYDKAMHAQYGGEWHAGRRDSSVLNTIEKIRAYPELIEQHVDEVMRIKKRLGKNFRFSDEYDRATYDFLAAIEQSHKTGKVVRDMAGAGGAARAAGTEFAKSDCPTGQAMTAKQALELQGIKTDKWHYGTCQACLKDRLVGECNICESCEAADNRGENLMAIRRSALARLALEASEKPYQEARSKRDGRVELANSKLFNEEYVKQIYGSDARLQYRRKVGDAVFEVVSMKTGIILNPDLKQGDYALGA